MHIPIIAQPFGACPIQSLRRGFFPVNGVHEDTGRVVIHRQPASLRQTLSSLPPIPGLSRLASIARINRGKSKTEHSRFWVMLNHSQAVKSNSSKWTSVI